jgi:hypothetical protein
VVLAEEPSSTTSLDKENHVVPPLQYVAQPEISLEESYILSQNTGPKDSKAERGSKSERTPHTENISKPVK